MATRTLTFSFERATKNTFVYTEDAGKGNAVVGTLYVQKLAFESQPAHLKVTIETPE